MWWFSAFLICWFIYIGQIGDAQTSFECVFQIQNRSQRHVVASTADEIGAKFTTFKVFEIVRKRRKRELYANDLVLATNSSYFNLLYEYYNDWHLVLAKCLEFTETKTLTVTLNDIISSGEGCEVQTVNITVDILPTKPIIIAPGNVNVNISSCKPGRILDVHQIRFNNTTQCTHFECVVRCINAIKEFWLETGLMIQASADNLDFNFIYQLQVACTDIANNETDIKYVDSLQFQVTFEDDYPCMETTMAPDLNITPVTSSSQVAGMFNLTACMALVLFYLII